MTNEALEYEVLTSTSLVVLLIVVAVIASALIGFSLGYQAERMQSCEVVKATDPKVLQSVIDDMGRHVAARFKTAGVL